MEIDEIIQAIVGIIIIAIFLGAFIPVLSQISPFSLIVFVIAMILLIAGIILSVYKNM